MYFFGLLAHSSGSATHLFSSDTLEEAIALFFTYCIKNTYTPNDAHLRLIKWSSKNFPEINCLDRELVIVASIYSQKTTSNQAVNTKYHSDYQRRND